MICKECGFEMILDNVDYDYIGKYDDYFNCNNCTTSCRLEVRFNKKHREVWKTTTNGKTRTYIVKHNSRYS